MDTGALARVKSGRNRALSDGVKEEADVMDTLGREDGFSEGWLLKLGTNSQKWQPRFLGLYRGKLVWYEMVSKVSEPVRNPFLRAFFAPFLPHLTFLPTHPSSLLLQGSMSLKSCKLEDRSLATAKAGRRQRCA